MTDLKERLKEQSQNAAIQQPIVDTKTGEIMEAKPPSIEAQFQAQLKKMEAQIARALPKHMTVDRFSRIVLTEIRRNPKLLQCMNDAPVTLWSSILLSAQLGVDLTPSLGQAYILPYWNKKTGKTEAQLQLGYRGLLGLVRNSGEIEAVMCETVFEKDHLEIQLGPETVFKHIPYLDGDAGEPKLYYMVAKFKGGGYHLEWMTKAQIEKVRQRSQSGSDSSKYGASGPWVTDYDEMAKKTVIKRASKKLPLSVEVQRKLAQDEVVKREMTDDLLEWQKDESNFDVIDQVEQ